MTFGSESEQLPDIAEGKNITRGKYRLSEDSFQKNKQKKSAGSPAWAGRPLILIHQLGIATVNPDTV